ncbi:MAG TPA: tetratricopeptide repeat protein [Steroidobacteraceae bacterium]
MSGFWSELKRRNVVKVGIAYGAAGWVVVQIAAVLFPLFGAPTWILKVVTTLVVLGFPLALVFAWAFELTPHGLKRSDDVQPDVSTTRRTGRQLDFLIIGVLAVAVALFALDKFALDEKPRALQSPADAAGEPAQPAAVGARNSIAVLPFVNMSNDPDQEYFSDGIAEELLNALARVKALKVAARTSAFSFKGKDVDLREVGRKLNVATVLEGSVRKSGERLRITAQLIDVGTGYHLWSEIYDRELTDIFAIQDDITSRIVSALQVHLDGGAVSPAPSQQVDAAVYQIVLRGRFHWNQRSPEGFAKAAELLQEATRRASDYAPAYAGLADVYLSQYDYGLLSWDESTVRARAAATKALELDDMSAAAHTSLAHILLHEWEWQSAEQQFRRAIELDPSYTLAQHWYALCLTALGRTDEAVKAMHRALQLDPLSVRINADLGMAFLAAGMHEEAVAQEGRALELAPGAAGPRWIRGMALEQMGRFDDAEADMKAAFDAWSGDGNIKGSLGHLYAISGKQAEARVLLTELTTQTDAGDVAFFAALICAGLNETDAALTWLERAVDERSGSVRYLKIDPRLADLRHEPRYRQLMERVGLPR